MGGFDVIALQSICANYFEKHVAPMKAEIAQLQDQVQALSGAKGSAQAGGNLMAKFNALQAEVASKASIARLDEVMENIRSSDLKASEVSTEVPSTPQLEKILEEADSKCSERLAPLEERISRIHEIVKSHASKIAACKSSDEELEGKANARDVPTLAQFQRLADQLKQRPTAGKVPSLEKFQELQELVETKASASGVPSASEIQELRLAMNKKANAVSVTSSADFEKFSKELQKQLGAVAQELENGLRKKADKDDAGSDKVVRSSEIDTLRNVMERKLTFLASRLQKTTDQVDNYMNQQAMVCYVPASQCGNGAGYPAQGPGGVQGAWVLQQAPGGEYAPGGWEIPQQDAALKGDACESPEGQSCA